MQNRSHEDGWRSSHEGMHADLSPSLSSIFLVLLNTPMRCNPLRFVTLYKCYSYKSANNIGVQASELQLISPAVILLHRPQRYAVAGGGLVPPRASLNESQTK